MFEYELFSVINHEGLTISNGHYTNYCRSQDDVGYIFPPLSVSLSLANVMINFSSIVSTMRKLKDHPFLLCLVLNLIYFPTLRKL